MNTPKTAIPVVSDVSKLKLGSVAITPVHNLVMPLNGMLRQFEKGKEILDKEGNPTGEGDKAYTVYIDRRRSMEAEIAKSGSANHTAIVCYIGAEGQTVQTSDGEIAEAGKLIVVDGMQRTGTAYEMGIDTPVKIEVVSKSRAREIMLSQAYHRKAHSPAQFTKILKQEIKDCDGKITLEDLSKRFAISASKVKRFLDLLTLPEDLVEQIDGSRDGITIDTGVTLADKIKRLADTPERKALLVEAARKGKSELEQCAADISAARAAERRAAKGQTPVYVPPSPKYSSERAKTLRTYIDNELADAPDDLYYQGMNAAWNTLHNVNDDDLKAHRAQWDKDHPDTAKGAKGAKDTTEK